MIVYEPAAVPPANEPLRTELLEPEPHPATNCEAGPSRSAVSAPGPPTVPQVPLVEVIVMVTGYDADGTCVVVNVTLPTLLNGSVVALATAGTAVSSDITRAEMNATDFFIQEFSLYGIICRAVPSFNAHTFAQRDAHGCRNSRKNARTRPVQGIVEVLQVPT